MLLYFGGSLRIKEKAINNKIAELSVELEAIEETVEDSNRKIEDIELAIDEYSDIEIEYKRGVIYTVIETADAKMVKQKNDLYNGYYSGVITKINGGGRYKYTGLRYNYADQYSIIIVDKNDKVLDAHLGANKDDTEKQEEINFTFTVPSDAAKIYIQSYQEYGEPIVQVEQEETYTYKIEQNSDLTEACSQMDYCIGVRAINRMGECGNAPQHSIDGFLEAYKLGFRILLCDLRFTADNVPVLFHDTYLNQNYKTVYHEKGYLVDTTNPIYICDATYEKLSQYDYGFYKGEKYKGYPLMTLYDMLNLCKKLGVELYIEIKDITREQAIVACEAVQSYGMSEMTSWGGALHHLEYIIDNMEEARVGLIPPVEITQEHIEDAVGLKTGKNEVFLFGWNTSILTDELVKNMVENDIEFEMGTINTEEGIIEYFSRGSAYQYCTGVESNKIVCGRVLRENVFAMQTIVE